MTIDRDGLRKLCEEATPGPWIVPGFLAIYNDANEDVAAALEERDSAFIAASRAALPALLDENERLREELETERMRLAACGVAALGYFTDCNLLYRSASLEDTLRLRAQLTAATERLADLDTKDEEIAKWKQEAAKRYDEALRTLNFSCLKDEELSRLRARVDELEKALRPFAEAVHESRQSGELWHGFLSDADLDAAAAALRPAAGEEASGG